MKSKRGTAEQLLEQLSTEDPEPRKMIKVWLALGYEDGSGRLVERDDPDTLHWLKRHLDQGAQAAGFILLEEIEPHKFLFHVKPNANYTGALDLLDGIRDDLVKLFAPKRTAQTMVNAMLEWVQGKHVKTVGIVVTHPKGAVRVVFYDDRNPVRKLERLLGQGGEALGFGGIMVEDRRLVVVVNVFMDYENQSEYQRRHDLMTALFDETIEAMKRDLKAEHNR